MRLREGTKIESQRDNPELFYCRFIAGALQVVICRVFVVREPCLELSSDPMPFQLGTHGSKKMRYGRSDGRTTDGRTDPYIEMRGRILKTGVSENDSLIAGLTVSTLRQTEIRPKRERPQEYIQ